MMNYYREKIREYYDTIYHPGWILNILSELDASMECRGLGAAPAFVCPLCACINVHFEKPVSIVTDNYDAWAGRGDCVRIPMWCEDGHNWNFCFGFHKGSTIVFLETPIGKLEHEEYGCGPHELPQPPVKEPHAEGTP